jgi:hypothetical protein
MDKMVSCSGTMAESMSIHWINFDRLTVYEAGAILVTLLAFPNETEDVRDRVHTALCACVLRATGENDDEWAASPQPVKPIYLLQTERDISRALRELKRRLRDRMVAARMAYPFLCEASFGEVPKLPPVVKRLSIKAMSELVLEDAAQSEPVNVESRIWRPSIRVIHLATAVHGYLHLYDGAAVQPNLGSLLCDRVVIEYAVRNAEHFEPLIGRSARLRINPDRLIKVRLSRG